MHHFGHEPSTCKHWVILIEDKMLWRADIVPWKFLRWVWAYWGFPTRMVYLCYISCLRYTILVGNPRIIEPLECGTVENNTQLWNVPVVFWEQHKEKDLFTNFVKDQIALPNFSCNFVKSLALVRNIISTLLLAVWTGALIPSSPIPCLWCEKLDFVQMI